MQCGEVESREVRKLQGKDSSMARTFLVCLSYNRNVESNRKVRGQALAIETPKYINNDEAKRIQGQTL